MHQEDAHAVNVCYILHSLPYPYVFLSKTIPGFHSYPVVFFSPKFPTTFTLFFYQIEMETVWIVGENIDILTPMCYLISIINIMRVCVLTENMLPWLLHRKPNLTRHSLLRSKGIPSLFLHARKVYVQLVHFQHKLQTS